MKLRIEISLIAITLHGHYSGLFLPCVQGIVTSQLRLLTEKGGNLRPFRHKFFSFPAVTSTVEEVESIRKLDDD